ncbi:MAG: sulfotransferase family protein [Chloroflexi bacterium]|nr:MAG: sulfotransferase family protein [Chloroflexota bacterium]
MKGFLKKLFSANEKKVVTVVSGLPRSGTSMMMKMLETGGIPPLTDKERKADTDNPKGYYEFERVKKLPDDIAWLPDADGKAVKVISQLLKHLPPNYEYRVIFMRRNLDEILASQKKMLLRRGENPNEVSDEELAGLFEKHLKQVFGWLHAQTNVSTLFVNYSEMLADPLVNAEKVTQFLGGNLDSRVMAEVVDPNLYRNRQEQ